MRAHNNDSWLTEQYGRDGSGASKVVVEKDKKESRRSGNSVRMTLKKFVKGYNRSDWYAIGRAPGHMLDDLQVMPFLSCGGFANGLKTAVMWMSSGGTNSVLHFDGSDNLNCLLSGNKRLSLYHPKWRSKIETDEMGWIDVSHPDTARHASTCVLSHANPRASIYQQA